MPCLMHGLDRASRDHSIFDRRSHVGGRAVVARGQQMNRAAAHCPSVSLSPV